MQFLDLRSEVKKIGFKVIRLDQDRYFEGFLAADQLPHLVSALEKFFGPPAVPGSKELSEQAREIAAEFGGIWSGQTFYFHSHENRAFFAMLWPWADKEHITLKLGQK